MKKHILLLTYILALSFTAVAQVNLPPGFAQSQLGDSLNPTGMTFDHHGNLYIAQKNGQVLLMDADGHLLPDPMLSLSLDDFNERGLEGIALHPNFDVQPYLYLYYTVKDSNYNRISRFLVNGNFVVPGSEQVLLNLDIMAGTVHNGGAMAFGKDGKLYIGVGDGGKPSNGQSITTTLGKILRINADGSIPDSNPFYSIYTGTRRAIYATGLRNPFSMSIHPITGRVFVSEVGLGAYEEVNDIVAGKNYGWNLIEGPITTQVPPANYQDPYYAYAHDQGCAIVGAAFYRSDLGNFPDEYQDKFFFADYCQGYIKVLDVLSGQVTDTFATGLKQPVAMAANPRDGSFYYLMRSGIGGGSVIDNTSSNNGTLWKVYYTGSESPFISVEPTDVYIPAGESAFFVIQALGLAELQYQWQKDNVDIAGANAPALIYPNVTSADHLAQFRCIVTNTLGRDTSLAATLSILNNQRPQPFITAPSESLTYKAGDALHFEGYATDPEDGQVLPSNLRWRVDFHHNTHIHPALDPVSGIANGTFIVPTSGETSTDVWYRFHLTGRDSEGLERSTYRDIYPSLIPITVSGPPGIKVNVDGNIRPMPYTFESLKRQQRTVQAIDNIAIGDTLYKFLKWQESADQNPIFVFTAPDTPGLTLHPIYYPIALGSGTGLHGEYFVDPEFDLDEEPQVLRLDSIINFNWGNSSPFPNQLPNNGYTIRWTGFVEPLFSETYTFYVTSDDGCRLWVNDSLIIDKWVPQPAIEHLGKIQVQAGVKTKIRLEYLEVSGGAEVSLRWSSPNTAKVIVPKRQLYLPNPYAPATISGYVWRDDDYDGLIDPTEPRLKEATVLLYDGSDATLMEVLVTDAQGGYKFQNLVSGAYYLRVVPGIADLGLLPGTNLTSTGQTILLNPGPLQSLKWDMAFTIQPVTISGICFHDLNQDANRQSQEPLLSDITVLLFSADSTLLEVQLTDALGSYRFSYLHPGKYFLQFVNALNAQTLDFGFNLSTQGVSPVWTLAQSQIFIFDAPFITAQGSVVGRVWLDENGNYFQDITESGLENVLVLLHRSDSTFISTTVSGADGEYFFAPLTQGNYFMTFLTNTLPINLNPGFGLNNYGQTPFFNIVSAQAKVIDVGFEPDSMVSVDSADSLSSLNLKPNPTSDYLILSNTSFQDVRFEITDLNGKTMTFPNPGVLNADSWLIEVGHLPAGMYLLHALGAKGKVCLKFVVI